MLWCLRAAEEGGFSYSIVRPGRIQGEPFLTYSKAKGAILSPDAPEKGSAKRMVSVKQGDTEAGDVNPSSVAGAFTQVNKRLCYVLHYLLLLLLLLLLPPPPHYY